MSGMHHRENNFYIGRKSDGSIRLLKLMPGTVEPSFVPDIDASYPDAILSMVIPASDWVDSVACCLEHWNPKALRDVLEAVLSGEKLTEEMVENYNLEQEE